MQYLSVFIVEYTNYICIFVVNKKINKFNIEKISIMTTIITLEGRRSHYNSQLAANETMTVGELIEYLELFNEDDKVILSNDRGYTFGTINENSFDELEEEEGYDPSEEDDNEN